MKKRVSFFVDGFNLYYALKNCSLADPQHTNYKWFNLKSFLSQYVVPNIEVLYEIYYFSALYPWADSYPLVADPSKTARHSVFIQALKSTGIHSILGNFIKSPTYCPVHKNNHHSNPPIATCSGCNGSFEKPEEKITDVNISVTMLKLAVKGEYDKGVLVSGDTDFIPAVASIKELCPNIQIDVLFPFKRSNRHFSNVADHCRKTKLKDYKSHKFPNILPLPDGTNLSCPTDWL